LNQQAQSYPGSLNWRTSAAPAACWPWLWLRVHAGLKEDTRPNQRRSSRALARPLAGNAHARPRLTSRRQEPSARSRFTCSCR